MISAGLPLVQCLDILSKQASKPGFGKIIADTTHDGRGGFDALGCAGQAPRHRPLDRPAPACMVAGRSSSPT
jgi:type II secretory pathway component PulF